MLTTDDGGRLGPDHVAVRHDAARNLVTIHRDARDIETVWHLKPDRWPAFLERIGQPGAQSVIDGVRRAVRAGAGAEVLTAASELAKTVFAEIDWNYSLGREGKS